MWREAPRADEVTAHERAIDAPVNPGSDGSEVLLFPILEEDQQRTGRGWLPGWWISGLVTSIAFHLWLLATMAGIDWTEYEPLTIPPLEARVEEPHPEEEEPLKTIEYELANPDDKEYEVRKVVNARSVGQEKSDKPDLLDAPAPVIDSIDVAAARPMYDIPQGREVDDSMVIKGTTGEEIVQIESALDRVTWEIATQLRERKVLVVWLLDASASLTEQRKAIARRLQRIYGELGALEETGELIPRTEKPLLTGVVSFGEKTTFLTREPTDDFSAVLEAVANVRNDESGRENVFVAVDQVVGKWKNYRTQNGRAIMLITVTDETGDDFAMLEPAVASCRRHGVKGYVIGPMAVFGRRQGFVPYVHPDDNKEYKLPVDLGPETFAQEYVNLPFWFGGQQYEYLSSGMGPYGLTRLVKETGGVYFFTNMTTMAGLSPLGVFSPERLRPFQPDYRFSTPEQYIADCNKSPLRRAVLQAAQISLKYPVPGTPELEMRVLPDNYLQTLSTAQQGAAKAVYGIDLVLSAFPANLEAEYQRERSPRWRANYNLTLGRLLAMKARAYEYNFACSQLKQLGTQDITLKTNHWIFRPDPQTQGGGGSKKIAAEAEKLLKRVVEEAPGTPWALLASRELMHPMGIKVIQKYNRLPTAAERLEMAEAERKRAIQLAREPRRPEPTAKPAPPPVLPKL